MDLVHVSLGGGVYVYKFQVKTLLAEIFKREFVEAWVIIAIASAADTKVVCAIGSLHGITDIGCHVWLMLFSIVAEVVVCSEAYNLFSCIQ